MGGGKSSGNQQTTVQPMQEQKDLLAAQTDFLKGTAFPAYQSTVGGAKDVLNQVAPAVQQAAGNASNVAGRTGALQEAAGTGALATGLTGLASLFGSDYKNQQVQGALQAGRESARESQQGQNAMYGGAGGLGSSRMALADSNMQSLNAQRQATAAAGAQAQVQANKANAANQLATIGGTGLSNAMNAAGAQVGYAGAPQDVYNKYASVVYGIPQANTTPNFAGTQSSSGTTSAKGTGFKI